MTIEVRCSALPRIEKCPPSAYIEGEVAGGEDAALGTTIHEAIGRRMAGGTDMGYPSSWGWMVYAAQRFVEQFGLKVLWVEKSLKGKLGAGITLTGHPDVIAERIEDGAIVIIDWKTGYRDRDYSQQLMGYGWLARRFLKPGKQMWGSTVWLRISKDNVDNIDTDLPRLKAWGKALAKRIRDAGADGERIPGEHCEYCPGRDTCPKRMVHMGSALALLRGSEGALALTREQIAQAYPLLGQIGGAIDKVRQLAREAVLSGGPISLQDGRELQLEETRDREIDVPAAWRFEGMPDLMDMVNGGAIDISVPALMRVIADRAPRGEKGETVEAFEKKLIDGGVLRVETKMKLAIRKREVKDDASRDV
jgi:hypothetical protein